MRLDNSSFSFTRPRFHDYVNSVQALRARPAAVYTALGDGSLPSDRHRCPLPDARTAHELQSRRRMGRLLLLP